MEAVKIRIKIPKAQAVMIFNCYHAMQSAQAYASSISDDVSADLDVKKDFRTIADDLKKPMARIDKRIPKEKKELYNKQIKDNDCIRLENIKALYYSMPVHKQDILETFCTELLKGNIDIAFKQ